jgi:hypothetical protein
MKETFHIIDRNLKKTINPKLLPVRWEVQFHIWSKQFLDLPTWSPGSRSFAGREPRESSKIDLEKNH